MDRTPIELHIVFEGDVPEARFVEVEDPNGRSLKIGRWEKRGDYWHFILTAVSATEG